MNDFTKKRIVVISIELTVAALLVLGAEITEGKIHMLYQSYFADVVIPFGFYFLTALISAQNERLTRWWQKALAVFGLCTTSEVLQYFGIYALATVFDPVDILMYAIGVSFAALIDRNIITRMFDFWD